jgi:hypothetical protein
MSGEAWWVQAIACFSSRAQPRQGGERGRGGAKKPKTSGCART